MNNVTGDPPPEKRRKLDLNYVVGEPVLSTAIQNSPITEEYHQSQQSSVTIDMNNVTGDPFPPTVVIDGSPKSEGSETIELNHVVGEQAMPPVSQASPTAEENKDSQQPAGASEENQAKSPGQMKTVVQAAKLGECIATLACLLGEDGEMGEMASMATGLLEDTLADLWSKPSSTRENSDFEDFIDNTAIIVEYIKSGYAAGELFGIRVWW